MIDLVIPARRKDLGDGFEVGRVLPYARRRMVGPFIFLDHMGPVIFKPGQGIHHINFGLYLKEKMDALKIECVVRHKDEVADPVPEMVEFFKKHFRIEKGPGEP